MDDVLPVSYWGSWAAYKVDWLPSGRIVQGTSCPVQGTSCPSPQRNTRWAYRELGTQGTPRTLTLRQYCPAGCPGARIPAGLNSGAAWLECCLRAGDHGLLKHSVGKLAGSHTFCNLPSGRIPLETATFLSEFYQNWHVPIEHFDFNKLAFADWKNAP